MHLSNHDNSGWQFDTRPKSRGVEQKPTNSQSTAINIHMSLPVQYDYASKCTQIGASFASKPTRLSGSGNVT